MHNRTLFFTQAFVLLCVGTLHIAALHWYLYWHYAWFDLITHFLGGMWVALLSAWLITFKAGPIRAREIIGIVLVVGIGWELFELFFGLTSIADRGYAFDTAHDLLMDFCGGLVGFFVAKRILPHDTITTQ